MQTPTTKLVFFLALIAFASQAQTSKLKSFTFTVSGTSTLHEWKSNVTKVEWKGLASADAAKVLTLQNVDVTIPVKGIISEHGRMMDNKTYEAFNSDKNPNITFRMKSFTQKVVNGDWLLAVEGNLTMNGVTNLIMLSITGKTLANGDLVFSGSRSLKMEDYKMEQPTAMMGTIKVGTEVTVKFDLTIAKNSVSTL
jgi:polyisoprenoid-binding protein YceI